MEENKRHSVLIVDDENSNILALTHILSSDYTVYAAKNGLKAVEAALKYLPDVILLDIVMPEMDGYAVLAALKESEATRHIPIMYITGLSNPGDEEKGLSLGAADYISKPFSPVIVKLRVHNQIQIISQTRMIIAKEIAIRSSQARSAFLSRMSHEMRTPLNAIMGMTTLAMNVFETDKRKGMLEHISTASGLLLKLIDDVLDMSDIEDNKLRLIEDDFDFGEMIQTVLTRMLPEVQRKQHELETEIGETIPEFLYGDDRRLVQVLLNLLANAAKFTPEHGTLKLRAAPLAADEGRVRILFEVIDNGIGIAKERQSMLFNPFEQVDGGSDRRFGGAGLGLAIAHHVVELMGGRIWVESEPGKGSKFSFTVEMAPGKPRLRDNTPISLVGKRLLMAEDMEINREIVIAMLEGTGLEIICASDGQEAVEIFTQASEKPDIILMDINMPEMDGIAATLMIREYESHGSYVPIIAMTANVLMSEIETYFAAGITDHIGKPVDLDKLMSLLYRHLR
ncbi:MAG: response regulator [Symbiobacteriaceae bacterium]|nr:response regulator [Symbiobacteriaceae bacterium]